MTNVPQGIRDAWADVYKLFDISFNMDGSDKAWEQYWNTANELVQKYADVIPLLDLFTAEAEILKTISEKRRLEKNHSLPWGKDEPYPYP